MMKPRLILFDCDGTLIDSQHMIIGAMQKAFTDCGLAIPEDNHTRAIIGLSLEEAVEQLVNISGFSIPPADVYDVTEAYRQAFFDLRLNKIHTEPMFEGAKDTLYMLNNHAAHILGVATGKSRRGLDAVLQREKLEKLFVTLQTADDAPSKPDPGMINNALAATGINRENTVMIGDTEYDIKMARNAGVIAIGVSWGYHDVDRLKSAGAHHITHDFDELNACLLSL